MLTDYQKNRSVNHAEKYRDTSLSVAIQTNGQNVSFYSSAADKPTEQVANIDSWDNTDYPIMNAISEQSGLQQGAPSFPVKKGMPTCGLIFPP